MNLTQRKQALAQRNDLLRRSLALQLMPYRRHLALFETGNEIAHCLGDLLAWFRSSKH